MKKRLHPPIIDDEARNKAQAVGIDLEYGYQRNTDKRYLLFKTSEIFPGAHKSRGRLCLRSRFVWWLYTGEILIGHSQNLHHKNHNRADDRFKNLEKIEHVAHSKHHNPAGLKMVERNCIRCRKPFVIHQWRLRELSRGKFCGQKCYHAHKRSDGHKHAISAGMKRSWAEKRR